MTKQQMMCKDRFVSMLRNTAEYYGKEMDYFEALDFANWLHRCEATLSRLAEYECGDENDYRKYDEAKQERYENRVEKAISEKIGCKCYTQRDARGYCIRLYLVNSEGMPWSNNWDCETAACNW